MKSIAVVSWALLMSVVVFHGATADDWTGFRGQNGSGISADSKLPAAWSDSKNLKWKTPLPGAGASSPIVLGDRVFVTCYSGYGTESSGIGEQSNLKRHLICINRSDGKILWSKSVPAVLPEDPYRGNISEHGYASSTPVTDGERVYVFFGKTGVLAFDFQGNQLWQTNVGADAKHPTDSSSRQWGSAAGPILYKDFVIVNASDESHSVRALDKKTGKEVWKAEAGGLELAYGTPALVDVEGGKQELVIAVPGEVWGLNPDAGKLRWYATIPMGGNICPSIVAQDGIVYVTGGFPTGGSAAIRAGGKDDVTNTHVLWTSRNTSYVPTPLLYDGHLYWVNEQGFAHCVKAKTGELVYQERVSANGGGRPRFYASLVFADGKLYAVSRNYGTFVLAAKPAFEQIAQNQFASDDSVFNATPAISNGQMFLRSNRFLYCVQSLSSGQDGSAKRNSPFRDNVKVTFTDTNMIVESDGIPDHPTGEFPNRYNPNRILKQNYRFVIPLKPQIAEKVTRLPMGPIGVAINGVPFYNPYNAEGNNAVEGPFKEVFDSCCGHPDQLGRYHYHKYPVCIKNPFKDKPGEHSPLIGYAFDGFAIYGPQVKDGKPPTDLDECNGHSDEERGYHYHVTDKFPYLLGAYKGVVEMSNFDRRGRFVGGRRADGSGPYPPDSDSAGGLKGK